MENFKIVYVNAEVKTLYVGLQEGNLFVNLYWNSGIDTSLEKEVKMQVITIGVDNGRYIEFLEFVYAILKFSIFFTLLFLYFYILYHIIFKMSIVFYKK